MLKHYLSIFFFFILINLSVSNTFAQSAESDGYNEFSIRKVHESYLMWNRTIWQRVDMKEKINQPFFSKNREMSKIIIDAVERGVLIAYKPDDFNYDSAEIIMGPDDFIKALEDKTQDIIECTTDENGCNDSGCPGDIFYEPCPEVEAAALIPPEEFSVFRLRENWYFDRIHSRYYFDTQTVTMMLSNRSIYNREEADQAVATFRFIDLYNLFKSMPKDAIWFNENNTAQHKNMGDAFLLRLFSGNIVKFSNIGNQNLTDIYDLEGAEGFAKSIEFLQMLMEWEANLWEY